MKTRVKRHAIVQPLDQSYRLIPLTRNKNTLVDAADYAWLKKWNWCTVGKEGKCYAARGQSYSTHTIYMHRQILGCTSRKDEGDHRNGNTLDNRRANLRRCTHRQNLRNMKKQKHSTGGYKGVCWEKRRGKWAARITFNGKGIHVGYFDDPVTAARAYDEKARELYGEFAHPNFPR